MPQITVTITQEELKALEWQIYDVQKWLQDTIKRKAQDYMNQAIREKADTKTIFEGITLDKASNKIDEPGEVKTGQ